MVYIIHGTDTLNSYQKLNLLIANYPLFKKVNFAGEATREEFQKTIHGQSLFQEKELIIGQNLIKNKVANPIDLKQVFSSKEIILWEDTELTVSQISKFKTIAKTESFKLPTVLFTFLDSIVPNSNRPFLLLQKLNEEGSENICWQIANRLFQLILAKKNISFSEAVEICYALNKSRVLDWQWKKILNQTWPFDIQTLKALYEGVLKIDFLQKSGAYSMDTSTLISILFLKYLKPDKNATIASTAHGRYSSL